VIAAIPRRAWHRTVFVAAGLYNISWGIYTAIDPQWLFRYAGMEPINHPEIMACLAMVIGLYGICYLEVARAPERGWLFAAVGLIGKLLGPIGAAVLILQQVWPPHAIVMCLTNDLPWWIPSALYLRDSWKPYRLLDSAIAAGGSRESGSAPPSDSHASSRS
jgi:hypothetical protein